MLVSEFISGTGPLAALQDPNSTRWTAAQRRGFLTTAVRVVGALHPEVRVQSNYERAGVPESTLGDGDEIPVDAMYLEPLAEYVLYLAFANDMKDEGNRNQAANHLAAYKLFFEG